MKKGQIYDGVVERVSFPNRCIVAVEGEDKKAIVKNALEMQRVRFRLKKAGGRCEGTLLEVTEPSPIELTGQDVPCPHFGECGGCAYQNLRYGDQLALKERQVRELLSPAIAEGGGDFDAVFEGIAASPLQFAYRNKMEFSFGDECRGGELALGMHRRGSFYDIVTVDGCRIVDGDFRRILRASLEYFSVRHISYFHKGTHEGYLRHLVVRKAAKTGEILIDLVTTTQPCRGAGFQGTGEAEPDSPGGTPAGSSGICEEIPEGELLGGFAQMLADLPLEGRLAGVLHTRNDSVADAVKDEGTAVLYGRDYFYEELLGLRFKISPFSFFQTNSRGAEVLYGVAREYAMGCLRDCRAGYAAGSGQAKTREPVIYDLYCGAGTIAQILAPYAKKVIGVELVEEAVEAARENAAMNRLDNCEFMAGDVLKVLDAMTEKPDFIVLDPPRDGIHPGALEKIIAYGAHYMVYVSCKPTSLARDLGVLQANGYRVERMRCVDMFPGTVHVETVVLMSRVRD